MQHTAPAEASAPTQDSIRVNGKEVFKTDLEATKFLEDAVTGFEHILASERPEFLGPGPEAEIALLQEANTRIRAHLGLETEDVDRAHSINLTDEELLEKTKSFAEKRTAVNSDTNATYDDTLRQADYLCNSLVQHIDAEAELSQV